MKNRVSELRIATRFFLYKCCKKGSLDMKNDLNSRKKEKFKRTQNESEMKNLLD